MGVCWRVGDKAGMRPQGTGGSDDHGHQGMRDHRRYDLTEQQAAVLLLFTVETKRLGGLPEVTTQAIGF